MRKLTALRHLPLLALGAISHGEIVTLAVAGDPQESHSYAEAETLLP